MGRCKPKGRYSPLLRCAPVALILLGGVLIERSLSQGVSPEIHVYLGTNTDGDGIPSGTGSVSFGQTLQAVPAPQTFTILNKGTANLVLSEPINLPAGFTLLRSFGSLVLSPGSSTTFVAALNAGDAASYSGPLTFTSNDPVNGSFNFSLAGGVTPFPSLRMVDDTDPSFSTVGQWTQTAGVGFQGGMTTIAPGTGTNTATWTVSGLVPGQYRVSATWNADPSAADNTPFTIQDSSTVLATVAVNQQASPGTFSDANQAWQDLGGGVYKITGNSLVVSVSDNADGNVFADAIRVERVGYSSFVSDDGGPTFSTAGGSWQATPGPGFQGGATVAPAGVGGNTATWTFPNLTPGLYRVMATWPANANQADNAPFTLLDGATVIATTAVNQQLAPVGLSDGATTWQDLGSIGFPVSTGTLTVSLSDNADGNVLADAVRVERINYATIESTADTIRFLEQASWGPNSDLIQQVQSVGFRNWLSQQFDANQTPPSSYPLMPQLPENPSQDCVNNIPVNCQRDNYSPYLLQRQFFTNAFYGPDQLRQRVAWSMHKIMVVSALEITQSFRMSPYLRAFDQVDRDSNNNLTFDHTFGNFRNLLYTITLNPAMGTYLNMATSTKTNPNENYAREIMQLFTIGLFQLNPDGTQVLDSNGYAIPTYDQSVVTNMAKVFTGWTFAPQPAPGIVDYVNPMVLNGTKPENAAKHDFTQKVVLDGMVIPARTPTPANAYLDLNNALDIICNHHNVAPFISQALIQELVTSNPSPGYVARVAAVFNLNRSNSYQMREVVRAILLDPEARGDVKTDPNYGHLREPAQLVANLCRAFNAKSANQQTTSDGYLDQLTTPMSQDIFRPPTVFSYFSPQTLLPGSATVLAPEFGIMTSYTSLKRINFVNQMAMAGGVAAGGATSNAPNGTALSLTSWQVLAGNPGALTDAVGGLLLHGTMSSAMRTSVVNAVSAVSQSNPLKRVRTAIYLIASSSQYQVAQ
ncbi:MAG TPA: DUF1800 family protein [Gemmataceae bacterium]|nr:DUF1800 family protein [Gemmataceae bacterium]